MTNKRRGDDHDEGEDTRRNDEGEDTRRNDEGEERGHVLKQQ